MLENIKWLKWFLRPKLNIIVYVAWIGFILIAIPNIFYEEIYFIVIAALLFIGLTVFIAFEIKNFILWHKDIERIKNTGEEDAVFEDILHAAKFSERIYVGKVYVICRHGVVVRRIEELETAWINVIIRKGIKHQHLKARLRSGRTVTLCEELRDDDYGSMVCNDINQKIAEYRSAENTAHV